MSNDNNTNPNNCSIGISMAHQNTKSAVNSDRRGHLLSCDAADDIDDQGRKRAGEIKTGSEWEEGGDSEFDNNSLHYNNPYEYNVLPFRKRRRVMHPALLTTICSTECSRAGPI